MVQVYKEKREGDGEGERGERGDYVGLGNR